MQPTSYIEISRSAVAHNVRFIKQLLGDKTVFSSVVKGNAYGHGIDIFAPLAYDAGVRHFSVFSADEAQRLMKALPERCPILIMGHIAEQELEWVIQNEIEFYVFDEDRLHSALELSAKIGKHARIHLEVETGMNRTGMDREKLPAVLDLFSDSKHLELVGVCTHLAGSESITNYHRIKKQRKRFKKILSLLENRKMRPPFVHAACSAATLRYAGTRYDLARIGILQYGFFPSREIAAFYMNRSNDFDYPLKRIITWKTQVMDTKTIPANEFVGYGTSYFTNESMQIALIPVGYAHGFSRSLSNQGRVLLHGQRINVLGMVNMNIIAVDISGLSDVKKGDEVVLIGEQGDREISVSSFGDYSSLVNYELLTRLPSEIPRIVVD
jgi:alanine racemase